MISDFVSNLFVVTHPSVWRRQICLKFCFDNVNIEFYFLMKNIPGLYREHLSLSMIPSSSRLTHYHNASLFRTFFFITFVVIVSMCIDLMFDEQLYENPCGATIETRLSRCQNRRER